MDVAEIIAELKARYGEDPSFSNSRLSRLTEADIQRWSGLCDGSRSLLYDQIAFCLACSFNAAELTFDFCDLVINDLCGAIDLVTERPPDLFWKIYLAFDEGEYYHGNNREEDPVEVYTRPMIASIIDGDGSAQ